MVARITLETSDFTVERAADGRIVLQIDGAEASAEIDMHPDVALDLMVALANPEGEPDPDDVDSDAMLDGHGNLQIPDGTGE